MWRHSRPRTPSRQQRRRPTREPLSEDLASGLETAGPRIIRATSPTHESGELSRWKRRGCQPTSGEAYDPSTPWVADAPSTAVLAAVLTGQDCGGSALSRL